MSDTETGGARTLALADHWLQIGRPERCLEVLRSADEVGLTSRAFELRTSALLELDRESEAAAEARAGLAAEPDNTTLLALLGIACRFTGDLAEGEQAFLSALQTDPENAWLLAQYALLLVTAGRIDKAKRVAEAAGRLDPDDSAVHLARGLVAHVEGRDAEASAIARQRLAQDPDDPHGHAAMAAFALAEGRIGPTAAHSRTAASIAPDADLVELAREGRVLAHPLMVPMRLLYRLGPAKAWLGAMAIIGVLTVAGLEGAAAVVAVMYVSLAVYSWIVPSLVRRWVLRRR